ncbi:MAG: serine/threonine-protein kinase [Acidobacteriota bacterium]
MNIDKLKEFFKEKYEFMGLLGRGGFAEVHLAMDRLLERKVAIKILLSQHSTDPDIVKRFIREARLYAKLEHKNLINIYDTGIAEGSAFIVMKYIKGKNLKYFIKEPKNIRLEIAPKIAMNMSKVLSYIHKNQIIHRDIKPANILIEDETQKIYLADFGIARSATSKTLTQSGSIMGTPYYISPEQIKGKTVDQRSDIYALGATLFELVTGKPIFTADSSIEILYKHVNDKPEPVGKLVPELSRELKYTISRCLEKKPEQRFQNALEIADVFSRKRPPAITRYFNEKKEESSGRKRNLFFLIFSIFVVTAILVLVLKDKEKSILNNEIIETPVKIDTGEKKAGKKKDTETEKKTENNIEAPLKKEIKNEYKEDKKNIEPDKKQNNIRKAIVKKPEKKELIEKETTREEIKPISTEKGTIRFSSFPPADVFWNDMKLGNTTQIFKKKFPPGKYTFTFKINGYMSFNKEITITGGKESPAHYRFKPFGFLTITAKPFAKFFINDIDYGENPIFKKKFPIGNYRIKAVKSGYVTDERSIKINQMKNSVISFSLKKEEKK